MQDMIYNDFNFDIYLIMILYFTLKAIYGSIISQALNYTCTQFSTIVIVVTLAGVDINITVAVIIMILIIYPFTNF